MSIPSHPAGPRGHFPPKRALLWLAVLCAALGGGHPLGAQPTSRTEEIQQARREKAAQAQPEELSKAETRLNSIVDSHIIERLATGFHGLTLRMGGLPTGQGFALGPQYLRQDLANGNLTFRTSAAGTSGGGLVIDLQVTLPKLFDERLFIDFYAAQRNLPKIDYFGQGPDSAEGSRTNFRLEELSRDFTVGYRPFRHGLRRPLSIGFTGGSLEVNTGPGSREDIAQTADVFTPQNTPCLDDQTDYLRAGFFAQFDYRDNPFGARKGGNYLARFTYYDDRELALHDFRVLHLEAQQFIPFFNDRRVIALRARTMMTFTNGAQTVPFYLQPVVGGSDDVRGFRPYRFYDNNSIVANAEYRWEAFTGLDAAVFFDAGKAVPKTSQLNFHDLEATAGFGFRFNVQNATFLRIDVGFSHERTIIWLKFGNIF